MNIIWFLVPIALLLAGVMLGGFVLAVRRGQFDDLETPARRMLLDDEIPAENQDNKIKNLQKERVTL
jgi:cbb3-type cytochrome oxidase maturation protein